MTIRFINCYAFGNRQDGINIGQNIGGNGISVAPGIAVEVIGGSTNNNGRNGITVLDGTDLVVRDHISRGNIEHGYHVVDSDLLSQFGLPKDVDIDKFNELLDTLKITDPKNREKAIYSSFLTGTLALFADASTIVMNILDYVDRLPTL